MKKILADKTLLIIDRILEVLLLILVFTIPFPRHKQSIETACFILIFILLATKWLFGKSSASKIKGTSIDLPIAVFTFFIILSVFFSYNPQYSLQVFRQFWLKPLLIFYFIVNITDTPEKLKRLIWVIIISSLGPLFAGILKFCKAGINSRLVSLFPGSNQYGRYLGSIILLLMGIFLWGRDIKSRIIPGLVLSIAVFSLLFTYSRGSWIAVFVSLSILFFLRSKKLTFIPLIVILIFSVFLPLQLKQRALSIFEMKNFSSAAGKEVSPGDDRLYIFKATINEIKKRPFVGFGFGSENFRDRYPSFVCEEVKELRKEGKVSSNWLKIKHAHNYFLEIGYESGIFALMAFLWLWIAILLKTWKNFINTEDLFIKGVSAGLLGAFIAKTVDWLVEVPHDEQIILTIWIFIGMSVAIDIFSRSLTNQEHS